MSALLAQAQQVQQQLMEAQEALANAEVHGQAGGGLVQVTMKGSGEVVGRRDRPQGRRPRRRRDAAGPDRRRDRRRGQAGHHPGADGSGRWPAASGDLGLPGL